MRFRSLRSLGVRLTVLGFVAGEEGDEDDEGDEVVVGLGVSKSFFLRLYQHV